jgi:large subunit ribosomal protein L10
MNREQKAAVIEEVAAQIERSEAIFAVDYRGLSVKEAADLRIRLDEAGASFRVVKNRLTQRAADQAGAEELKTFLVGPTAFTFVVDGDVALAAKALARFRRETETLEFKGGRMGDEILTVDQIESIARLPGREQLNAQFVGVLASPITTLVRGLASLISGLAIQLRQIEEQGLVGGGAAPAEAEAEAEAPAEAEAEAPAEAEAEQEAPAEEESAPEPSEAPGDPVAEGEAAEQEAATETETPSEGEESEEKEG